KSARPATGQHLDTDDASLLVLPQSFLIRMRTFRIGERHLASQRASFRREVREQGVEEVGSTRLSVFVSDLRELNSCKSERRDTTAPGAARHWIEPPTRARMEHSGRDRIRTRYVRS